MRKGKWGKMGFSRFSFTTLTISFAMITNLRENNTLVCEEQNDGKKFEIFYLNNFNYGFKNLLNFFDTS